MAAEGEGKTFDNPVMNQTPGMMMMMIMETKQPHFFQKEHLRRLPAWQVKK